MPVNPKEAPQGHKAVQYDPQNGTRFKYRGAEYEVVDIVYRVQYHDMNCTPTGRKDGMAVIFVSIGHPPDGDE